MNVLPANVFSQFTLGISITQSALRAVVINSKNQVIHTAQVQLAPNTLTSGVVDVALLSQQLKSLLDQIPKKISYVSVTLPEYYSYSRSYKLNQVDQDQIGGILNWKIEEILPLPKETIYFDWRLISKEEEFVNILVVAMNKTTLDSLIEVFEKVKIKPTSFEPSISALTRVLTKPKENDYRILVEVSPNGSSATLIHNNLAMLTITHQFQSTNPTEISQALQKTSESIVSLFNYCQSNFSDFVADQAILLTGESASNEVAEWLANLVSKPVEILQIPQITSQFHQAYGAAIATVDQANSSDKINLLPDKLRSYYEQSRLLGQIFSSLRLSYIFGLVALVVSIISWSMAMNQNRNSFAELMAIESSNTSYTYNSQEINTINQNSLTIVKHFAKKKTATREIQALYDLLNENIILSSISYKQGSGGIEISGFARDRASLLGFVDNIKNSELFSKADLPVDAYEAPENISFSLLVQFK